ncbi:hypothetical protein QEH52_12660 [Coraliomargarita sp. SDUM461003]|uniref:PEP-CTERM protein-sorting domain-containing protein n=1 Tax=Thalassobacterium maritimum TaxID=3041265 RepID=A0ABU1AWA7_9BACT|nr:hypothetical protein [Coraliomargarita sp. SDUM461003]MDQ8208368.1 hypothetical protein [Coraliomargarita sp. SDUM461003]
MTTKKQLHLLRNLSLVTVGLAFGLNVGSAQTYAADDWYSFNTGTSIDNGATNTATLNYGGTDTGAQTYFWSHFADPSSPVTLSDGDTLSYSAGITFDYATVTTSRTVVDFRFGIYDSGSQLTTAIVSDRLATSPDQTSYREDWTGIFFASGNSNIYRREAGSSTPFSTSSTTTGTVTDAPANQSFGDNVAVALNLFLERSGDDLLVSGNFGSSTIVASYEDYFASAYPATFDTIGFYMASAGASANLNSMTISNATVTVPEASNFAAILGLSAIGFVCVVKARRRR